MPNGVRPVKAAAHGTRETVQQDASRTRAHHRLGQHGVANPEGGRPARPLEHGGQALCVGAGEHVPGGGIVALGNKVFARMGGGSCARQRDVTLQGLQ